MSKKQNLRVAASISLATTALFAGIASFSAQLHASPEQFYATPQIVQKMCYRHQLLFWHNLRLEKYGCRDERKLLIACVDTVCVKKPKVPPTALFSKEGDGGGGGGDDNGGKKGGMGNTPSGTIN